MEWIIISHNVIVVKVKLDLHVLLTKVRLMGISSAFILREYYLKNSLQSPPKESIHFCGAKYSKLRGAR